MSANRISINLESLLELSGRLNETYDEMFILNSALLSLMGKLRVFRGCVLLPDDERRTFSMALAKGKTNIGNLPYFEVNTLLHLVNSGEQKVLYDKGYRYCLPVIYQEELMAVICLSDRLDQAFTAGEEEHYARLVSTITANALQNARNHNSLVSALNNLESRNQLLTTLFEMSSDFSSLLSRSHILKMLSYRLMGQLMVSRFAVFLKDNGGFHSIINRFDTEPSEAVVNELACVSKICRTQESIFSNKASLALAELKAEVISPMINQGDCKGLLLIGRKMSGEDFSNENLQFIEVLGNTSITALENERLFQEELEKERLESELKLALEIQVNLLPDKVPEINGFDIAGTSIPSRHVGGDYFDFIRLEDGKLLVAIADVAGKGMPAALLMANVQAALRSLAPLQLPLTELVMRINNIVYHNTAADKFVTFFCGILDPKDRSFRYLNAGHNPPILLKKDGSLLTLTEGGLILGFMDTPFPYSDGLTLLDNGDILLFYTDGITESPDLHKQEFGEKRLEILLRKQASYSAHDLMNTILEAVHKHSGDQMPFDDLTLVVLKAL